MTAWNLPIEERINKYLDKREKHWLWTGSLNTSGRPHIRVNGKTVLVSRLVYELYKGEVPKDMEVMHDCDIGTCLNPDCLTLGTHAQNMKDAAIRNRLPQKKLSDETVREIIESSETAKSIALKYNISRDYVYELRKRTKRKHVMVAR